ncbi:MAG: lytic transglycosylase domain-containing protein [Pseudomonadota bacterium]|nr:lytic transglycosylase domain-containing protein [Pseudomonadota bacterium]
MLAALLGTTCLFSGSAVAQLPPAPKIQIALPDASLRHAFEDAARGQLDEATRARYASHPLAGWLEFGGLRRELPNLPLERGTAFLSKYRDQSVSAAFRNEWLAALAKRQQWQAFMTAWSDDIDDPALRCMQVNARRAMGRTDAGWVRDAQALWRSSGRSLPDACDAVFTTLAAQGGLSTALRWERIELAANEGQTGVMRAVATGLEGNDAALASRYAAYVDAPDGSAAQWPKTARSRLIASAALAKLAKASPDRAETLLPGIANALGFDEAQRGAVLAQVALWTVASYLPDSARRLAAVPASAYDEKLHEWRVREALTRSDWAAALSATRKMGAEQRKDSRWQYFAARTSELTGDASGAQALYRQAAQAADFHGFLAADRLQQPYALCPWTPVVTATEKAAVARDPRIVRALQLFALDRKSWAVREWNDALSRFSDAQRRIAVDVAQDNGWFDRGVFGLVNVGGKRYPDEIRLYRLRFPLHHDSSIRREAARNNLDPAWIAAEIRAESVFDPNARSSADARGLMQVLPGTGAMVAAKIGMPWKGGESLYDADTNIVLGTAYLRQLMDKYGGKPYQVMAGYNAGPAPLNRWISQRPTMDPDFWIETISYKETRDYVARVLAFSTVYDWRLNGDALRVSDRLLGRTGGSRKQFTCTGGQAVKPMAPATVEPATKPASKARRRR